MYSLTFDLGTTFFKACLFDQSLDLLALASVPTPIKYPQPGWAQIDSQRFCQTVTALLGQLNDHWPDEYQKVSRIGFATQANSFVLLDEKDCALTPIILWTDLRGKNELSSVSGMYGQTLYQTTGVAAISAQMIPSKLAWIQKNQPDIWQQARRFCSISDYLTFWLTGEHLSEAGAACLTGMVDIHKLKWTEQSIDTLNLNHIKLPRIVCAGEMAGKLKHQVADEFGINRKCKFVVGCLDQYAGAIGAGNTIPGVISETTGTVMATVSMAENFDTSLKPSLVIQGPAFAKGKFYRMVAGNVSANLIEKYRKENAPNFSYEQLDGQATAIFNATNENEPSRRAGIGSKNVEQTNLHGKALLAIYQRIAGALAEQVGKVAPGNKAGEIFCVGGAAASNCLLKLKADALGMATVALKCAQPTSLGAAILAQSDITPVENAPKPEIRARFEPGKYKGNLKNYKT